VVDPRALNIHADGRPAGRRRDGKGEAKKGVSQYKESGEDILAQWPMMAFTVPGLAHAVFRPIRGHYFAASTAAPSEQGP